MLGLPQLAKLQKKRVTESLSWTPGYFPVTSNYSVEESTPSFVVMFFFSLFSDSHRFHVINAFQKGDLASCLDLIDHLLWLAGYVPPNIFLNWASYLYALHQAECAPQPSSERRRENFRVKSWNDLG